MRKAVVALFASALIAPAQAAPPPEFNLQPTGKWRVDYADNGCVLSRPFTSSGQEYKLALTFEPVTADVWMRFRSTEPVNHRDSGDSKIEIDGAAVAKPIHFNIFKDKLGGATREYWLRDFRTNVALTQHALRLETGKYGDIRVAFDGFADAMKSVDTCMDDLHRSLGIDPALLKAVATPPEGLAGKYFELPDFSKEFTYQILYWVTPAGRVDECHLLALTGKASFDKNACEQLKKKGQFIPAKNAAGQAIRAPVYDNATIIRQVFRTEG